MSSNQTIRNKSYRIQRATPYIEGTMGRLAYSANNTANAADLREWSQSLHDDLAHALAILKGEEPTPDHIADAGKVIPTD